MKKTLAVLLLILLTVVGCSANQDRPKEVKSEVVIKTYYEEPPSLKDQKTLILKGLMEGEFVEVIVTGEVKEFKHVAIEWDEQKKALVNTRIINEVGKLTNQTIVIKTYMPEGIPAEKIEWTTVAGEKHEFIIQNGE